jgi:hypothetical protein
MPGSDMVSGGAEWRAVGCLLAGVDADCTGLGGSTVAGRIRGGPTGPFRAPGQP